MFCRKCGTQIPNDSVFCYKCGVRVDTTAAQNSTEYRIKFREQSKSQQPQIKTSAQQHSNTQATNSAQTALHKSTAKSSAAKRPVLLLAVGLFILGIIMYSTKYVPEEHKTPTETSIEQPMSNSNSVVKIDSGNQIKSPTVGINSKGQKIPDTSNMAWDIQHLFDCSTLLTPVESPVWVFETWWDDFEHYTILPNPQVPNSHNDYFFKDINYHYGDGTYPYLELPTLLYNCFSINGINVMVTGEDEENLSKLTWYCAARLANDTDTWIKGDEFDLQLDKYEEAAFYNNDLISVHAVIVAPMDLSRDCFYCESQYTIWYDTTNIRLKTFSKDAAKYYLEDVGLSEYCW